MLDHVGMYWDVQNIHASIEQVIAVYCFAQKCGEIKKKNAYADWRCESKKLANLFDDLEFKCINAPACKAKKNNADKKLIEVCLQNIRNNPEISTVFLVSGDKDFIPLVRCLKALSIQVILIIRSEENTSLKLKNIVDKFYSLDWIEKEFGSPCFDDEKRLYLINK